MELRPQEQKWLARHIARNWLSAVKEYELAHACMTVLGFLGKQRNLIEALVSQLGR